jgi:rod shape-determining protein MreC
MAVPFSRTTPRINRWWWLIGRLFTVLLVIIGMTLLILNKTAPELIRQWRGTALDWLAPVMGAVDAPIVATSEGTNWIGGYLNAHDKAAALDLEVKRLTAELQQQRRLATEAAQLKALLKVAEPRTQPVRAVRVVAASSASYVQTAVATAGRRHGLRPGQPVRDATGLIGQTVEVGQVSTRILLVTDGLSHVPVVNVRSGQAAIVNGENKAEMSLTLLEPGTQLTVGDQLVTSGEGYIYPPGIPVGTVTAIVLGVAYVTPSARLRNMSYALVLKPFLPEPVRQPTSPAEFPSVEIEMIPPGP